MKDIEKTIRSILEESLFLADIARISKDIGKSGLFSRPVLRPLQTGEIELLQKNNNTATDWRRIQVTDDFSPNFIHNNRFHRDMIIGSLSGSVSIARDSFTSGIFNSFLSDTVIGDGALVQNVGFCARMCIGKSAVLMNVMSIAHSGHGSFSAGSLIPAGNEAGKRLFPFIPELLQQDVCTLIEYFGNDKESEKIKKLVASYVEKASSKRGIIGDNAVVSNSVKIMDIFAGNAACIDGALEISNSIILSEPRHPVTVSTGVVVRDSVLQWGACVDSCAVIEKSFLAEYATAEKHAKITNSYIGPMSHIAEGEVSTVIAGPFISMHHQSLLIAACWPEGKGNVAYGANIGSNHTGKKNDQEIWPGEGTFFGLGSTVKFPCNFKEAPYSIIASGVTLLPQKIIFPFSLINTPSQIVKGQSPALNEILPGWVLSENFYAVIRNEHKFAQRLKETRSLCTTQVFHEETLRFMLAAKSALEAASGRDVYTEINIPGLGKNFCTETNRKKAVETYAFFIRLFALRTICAAAKTDNQTSFSALVKSRKTDQTIQHAVTLLESNESGLDIKTMTGELIDKKEELKALLLESKQKDDFRGRRIFENYEQTHITSREDAVMKEILTRIDAEIQDYKSFLK